MDDMQHELLLDEGDFIPYKETSRDQLPISKSSTLFALTRNGYPVLRGELLSDDNDCRDRQWQNHTYFILIFKKYRSFWSREAMRWMAGKLQSHCPGGLAPSAVPIESPLRCRVVLAIRLGIISGSMIEVILFSGFSFAFSLIYFFSFFPIFHYIFVILFLIFL
jgi:hypothetical protein